MKTTLAERIFRSLEATFVVLISFLILSVLIIVRQKLCIKAENLIEPSWLVLALLPLLVWLIASRRLLEFSAGAITAKFTQISAQPLAKFFGQLNIGSQVIEKMSPSLPEARLGDVIINRPAILALILGWPGYTDAGIQKWVERLLETGSLRYVAFIDEEERLQKYIHPSALLVYLARMGNDLTKDNLSSQIEKSQLPNIPGLRTERLQNTTTNRQAVKYLSEKRFNDVPVVDEQGKLIGLVQISDIVANYVSLIVLEEEAS